MSVSGYPSGFRADYQYTSLSYLSAIVDHGTGSAIWTANTADAELHLTQATAGNGVITTDVFDANTGGLVQTEAGVSGAPTSHANLTYEWDAIGNLTSRTDLHGTNRTESFCYDALNRLTSYGLTTSSACPVTASGAVTMSYVPSGGIDRGNIVSKSDVGTYTYSGGGAGSHAVTSIAGTVAGVANPSFFYDANGNMQCVTTHANCGGSAARSMTWTASNKLSSLTDATTGNSFALAYDTNHARIRQCAPNCSSATAETDYVNDPVTGAMEEVVSTGGTSVTWNDYIQAAGQIVAMRTQAPSSTSYLYFASDQLGSISLITDSTGSVIGGGRQSYDSWGLRRNATDWTPPSSCNAITSATTRGYTAQEEIDGGCLVNLNGRIYDPTIGRFLSADPYVPDQFNTQSFNRYSYVVNKPLSLIDPSGYNPCGSVVPDPNGGPDIVTVCPDPSIAQSETGGASAPPRGIPGAPGGGSKAKEAICKFVPTGQVASVNFGAGGLGGLTGSYDVVMNYATGQVSTFTTGGAFVGWNGGASASISSGYIFGNIGPTNKGFSGGFTTASGSLEAVGGFVSSSSGGIGNPRPNGSTIVAGATLGTNILGTPSGTIAATNTSTPTQIGQVGIDPALDPLGALLHLANEACGR